MWWLEGIATAIITAAELISFRKLGVVIQNGHFGALRYVDQATDPGGSGFAVDWGLTVSLTFALPLVSFSFISKRGYS